LQPDLRQIARDEDEARAPVGVRPIFKLTRRIEHVLHTVNDDRPGPVGHIEQALDAQQLLAALTTRFGGRGGGRSELAQGGLDAAADEIIAAVRVSIMAEQARNL